MNGDILCRATDAKTIVEENRVATVDGKLDEIVLLWLVEWIPIASYPQLIIHSSRLMSEIPPIETKSMRSQQYLASICIRFASWSTESSPNIVASSLIDRGAYWRWEPSVSPTGSNG